MANRRSIQQFESGLDELVSYRDRSQPHHGPHGLDEAPSTNGPTAISTRSGNWSRSIAVWIPTRSVPVPME